MVPRRSMPASVFAALVGVFLFSPASARSACEPKVGRFVSSTGEISVQRSGGGAWLTADLKTELCEGDSIRVGERSRAAVALINDAVLRLDENTTLRLLDIAAEKEERSWLEAVSGAFQSFSRQPRRLTVNTPYLNGSIEGTEFLVRVGGENTQITVFEGVVVAANDQGELPLNPGESAQAAKGQAPQRRTVVRPRDQVQWALYYPPVISAAGLAQASPGLAAAADCAADGNTACAFAELDKVPAGKRDAEYALLRASVLLSVGRVDEARSAIDAAQRQNPDSGDAYALRAVIGVVQSQNEAALADGQRAVELSPESAAARIALSYALQSRFDIEAARDTMRTAVEQHPDDALALARLAELELMLGNHREALAASQKAASVTPGLSRTELVLGFNALASLRIDEAQAAFARAIALDSADPLARLGLGLAKIRQNMLEEGRADLEAAVALDSNNALLRAYLGKAYFEEKRGPLDAQQWEIAKELDPRDPTAYLYSGIGLQTENRPVEALEDIEQSIALNDNRAVYRSRLLLDSDSAARGASLARVYNDLGFADLALVEGWKSVNTDPTSYPAHRFLADSYAALPRHEIARVSELLQSQLLQPLNARPIQPSLAESDLYLIGAGGPAVAGFNEFNSLFIRDGNTFQVTGLVGGDDTYGGEVVFSRIGGNASLSMGLSHFNTDGWRDNADQRDTIANVFWQMAISPDTSIQAEYRYRKTEYGDLLMRFFPDEYYPGQQNEVETYSIRAGGRHDLASNSTLLASIVYQHADSSLTDDQFPNPFFGAPDDPFFPLNYLEALRLFTDLPENAYSGELQHLYSASGFKLTSGLGYFHVSGDISLNLDADVGPLFGFPPETFIVPLAAQEIPTEVRHFNAYSYAYLEPLDNLSLTLGGSVDRVYGDFPGDDTTKFNPKVGAIWNVTPATTIRAAYFTTLKRTLITNQTLEPTQVAGFNQFYDDYNLTEAKRYGVALDQKFSRQIYGGVELSKRDLDVPFFDENNNQETASWDEQIARAYLFWTPTPRLGVRLQYSDEQYTRDESFPEGLVDLDTSRVELGANYFHPNGLGATVNAAYIEQDGDFRGIYASGRGSDSFWVVDAAISYRLPARRGIISLGVANLLDEDFNYFDVDLNNSSIHPGRTVLARATIEFQ